MKLLRLVYIIAMLSLLLLNGTGRALAQSTDQSQPTALTSNQIAGEDEATGRSYFYSFFGGPGDITVSVDSSTNYYSTNMHLFFRDETGRELANVNALATTDGAKKIEKLHLQRRQPITLQVLFGVEVGIRVKYKINIDGPVYFQADPGGSDHMFASTESSSKSGMSQTGSSNVSTQPTVAIVRPDNATRGVVPSATAPVAQRSEDESGAEQVANDAPIEDKWALIVGVSKFQRPDVNLKYSAKDAKDLYAVLTIEGHFAPDHVKLLLDEQATKERVLAELGDKWLPRLARPNDLVVIFISSHGSPSQMDLEGLNYLVMHNTDPDSLYATGLPLQDLAAVIKHRVHANRVVVIIDACHSGAANPAKGLYRAGNVDSDTLLQGTGQLVICSSQPSQVSWESKRYQNGVFTRQLIDALRSKSGKVTLGQAFERMKESVQSEVLLDRSEMQVPVLKSKWHGNALIITAPPTNPRPVPDSIK